jgi:hypothetical protein
MKLRLNLYRLYTNPNKRAIVAKDKRRKIPVTAGIKNAIIVQIKLRVSFLKCIQLEENKQFIEKDYFKNCIKS